MDSSTGMPVLTEESLSSDSDYRSTSGREKAFFDDDFSSTHSPARHLETSTESHSGGRDQSRESRLWKKILSVEDSSTRHSSDDSSAMFSEFTELVDEISWPMLSRIRSSVPLSQKENDGSVIHSVGSHTSGQGVKYTTRGHKHYQDQADSNHESDQENSDRAIPFMVSNADRQEVNSKDQMSSQVSQDNAKEPHFRDKPNPSMKSPIREPNHNSSTFFSSHIKSASPLMKASAPPTQTPDICSTPSEASLAPKMTASSSVYSRAGRRHDEENDGSVIHSMGSRTSGQGVERTISGHMHYQGHADSSHESDQENNGHAIPSMVSNADRQGVNSKDQMSSQVPQDHAKEPNLRDKPNPSMESPIREPTHNSSTFFSSHIKSASPLMKASAPPTQTPDICSTPSEASLAPKMTASSSVYSQAGRCHDEENDSSVIHTDVSHTSGQGVERTISGHLHNQGHADSSHESDQENNGHAIPSMVSNADRQGVNRKDQMASQVSQDHAKEPNLRDKLNPSVKSPIRQPNNYVFTFLLSKIKSASPLMKASAPPTQTPDICSTPSEASLAPKMTASSSVYSQAGRRNNEENDSSVTHSVDTGGQGVELTISGHLHYQGHAVSSHEPDQENNGHAIPFMVSNADRQGVNSKDQMSSQVSQDHAKEPNLRDKLNPSMKSPIRQPNHKLFTFLLSKIKSASPLMKASAPPTQTPDICSTPSEASLAPKMTASSSVYSQAGRCHDEENDSSVIHTDVSHTIGQGVERTIRGHLHNQGHAVSSQEPDQENNGHAIPSMVSNADRQVVISKDQMSSQVSQDNAKEPNLRDQLNPSVKSPIRQPNNYLFTFLLSKIKSASPLMKASAPPTQTPDICCTRSEASLAPKMTASSSVYSRAGRRHNEENDSSVIHSVVSHTSGQGVERMISGHLHYQGHTDSNHESVNSKNQMSSQVSQDHAKEPNLCDKPNPSMKSPIREPNHKLFTFLLSKIKSASPFMKASVPPKRSPDSCSTPSEASLTQSFAEGVECELPSDKYCNPMDMRDSTFIVEPSASAVASNKYFNPKDLRDSIESKNGATAASTLQSSSAPTATTAMPEASVQSNKAAIFLWQPFKLRLSKSVPQKQTNKYVVLNGNVAADADAATSPLEKSSTTPPVNKMSQLAIKGAQNRSEMKVVNTATPHKLRRFSWKSSRLSKPKSVPCEEVAKGDDSPASRPSSPRRLQQSSPEEQTVKPQSLRAVSSSREVQTSAVVTSNSPSKAIVGRAVAETKPVVSQTPSVPATCPKSSEEGAVKRQTTLLNVPPTETKEKAEQPIVVPVQSTKSLFHESKNGATTTSTLLSSTAPSTATATEKSLVQSRKRADKATQNGSEMEIVVDTVTPHKLRLFTWKSSKLSKRKSLPSKEAAMTDSSPASRPKSALRLQQSSPEAKTMKPQTSRAVSSSREVQTSAVITSISPSKVIVRRALAETKPVVSHTPSAPATCPKSPEEGAAKPQISLLKVPPTETKEKADQPIVVPVKSTKSLFHESKNGATTTSTLLSSTALATATATEKSLVQSRKRADKATQNGSETEIAVDTATPPKLRLFTWKSSKLSKRKSHPGKEAAMTDSSPVSRPKSALRLQQSSLEEKTMKPHSSRAVSSSCRDQTSVVVTPISLWKAIVGPAVAETKPTETQTLSKKSHFRESNHRITMSSVLTSVKTLASAAFDDSLCGCCSFLKSKNETGGTEPNNVEQVECILLSDMPSNPMKPHVVIQTTSPCAAKALAIMPLTTPSGGKASNVSPSSMPNTPPKPETSIVRPSAKKTLVKGMKKISNKIILAGDTGAKRRRSQRIVIQDGMDFGAAKNNGRGQSQERTTSSRKRSPRRPLESCSLHGRHKSKQTPVQTEGRNEIEEPRDLVQSESDDFWNDTEQPRDLVQSESDDFWNDTEQPRDLVQSESDDFWA